MSVVRHVAAPVLAVALTAGLIASARRRRRPQLTPPAPPRTQGCAEAGTAQARTDRGGSGRAGRADRSRRRLRPGASSTWPMARFSAAST